MKNKSLLLLLITTLILGMILPACSPPEAPVVEEPVTLPAFTKEVAAEMPPTAEPIASEEPMPEFEGKMVAAESCDYGGKLLSIIAVDRYTVVFNMCSPDPAFPQKAAFPVFGIYPEEWLNANANEANQERLLRSPIGTGPFIIENWESGESITFKTYDGYWGEKPVYDTLVFRWAAEGAQRLRELQSGSVDQITNPDPDDYETIKSDLNLVFIPVTNPNIFYLGMTNTFPPFDNVKVRQAIAMGIDRQYIVDNFYPEGAAVADFFTPCILPNGCVGEPWYDFDPETARGLLAEAGYSDGFETAIYYRDVFRSYLPEPGPVAVELQTQLRDNLGIEAEIIVMDASEFINESTNGRLDGFYLLGWEHVTNFLDYHFSEANRQFGEPYSEINIPLQKASRVGNPDEIKPLYVEANNAIRELVPMIPIANGASASAALTSARNAHYRPFGAPLFEKVDPGKDTFTFMQNAEPISLFCQDESDRESLTACQQVTEALLGYAIDSGEVVPKLATGCSPNEDSTVWTCFLRQGVTFHDGSSFDANDVVASWAAGIDASNPNHIGNTGSFIYYDYLWDGLLNTSGGTR